MFDNDTKQKLLAAAREAKARAYAPYSGFRVGAALLAPGGEIISGCNVENSSYGLTICAERVAVGTAVARGLLKFDAVAVSTDAPAPVSPCGACRQVLYEFNPDMIVICESGKGEILETPLSELLPHGFRLRTD